MATLKARLLAAYEKNALRSQVFLDQMKPLLEPIKSLREGYIAEKFWKLREQRNDKARKKLGAIVTAPMISRQLFDEDNKNLLRYAEILVKLNSECIKNDCILEEVMNIALDTCKLETALKAVEVLAKAGEASLLKRILYGKVPQEIRKAAGEAYRRLGGEISG